MSASTRSLMRRLLWPPSENGWPTTTKSIRTAGSDISHPESTFGLIFNPPRVRSDGEHSTAPDCPLWNSYSEGQGFVQRITKVTVPRIAPVFQARGLYDKEFSPCRRAPCSAKGPESDGRQRLIASVELSLCAA